MQAPNKVYILPSQYNLQYDNGGEEYIRKNALLEWAKDMIECGATLLATDTLIDKLNSM